MDIDTPCRVPIWDPSIRRRSWPTRAATSQCRDASQLLGELVSLAGVLRAHSLRPIGDADFGRTLPRGDDELSAFGGIQDRPLAAFQHHDLQVPGFGQGSSHLFISFRPPNLNRATSQGRVRLAHHWASPHTLQPVHILTGRLGPAGSAKKDPSLDQCEALV